MICPPEDGSREEAAQVLELVSGLFGQEILGREWSRGMYRLLPWSYWLFIQWREAQPEEGQKRASRVLGQESLYPGPWVVPFLSSPSWPQFRSFVQISATASQQFLSESVILLIDDTSFRVIFLKCKYDDTRPCFNPGWLLRAFRMQYRLSLRPQRLFWSSSCLTSRHMERISLSEFHLQQTLGSKWLFHAASCLHTTLLPHFWMWTQITPTCSLRLNSNTSPSRKPGWSYPLYLS